MSMLRRKYTEEFKIYAVRLSRASTRAISEIARDLGVHEAYYTVGERSISLRNINSQREPGTGTETITS